MDLAGSARRALCAAGLTGVAVIGTAAISLADNPASGTTDTGQALNVAISSPADGAVLPAGTTSVPLTGQVSLGNVPVTGEAHVAVVLDESGSLGSVAFNQEKAAANALHRDLEAIQGIDVFSSAIFFGTVSHVAHADAPVLTDLNANGIPDFRDAVTAHPYHQGYTDYRAALDDALGQLTGKPGVKMVFFISDGQPNGPNGPSGVTPTPQQIQALQDQGIVIHAYALGNSVVPCEDVNSALQELADATGGTCTNVVDPDDLDAALTGTQPAGIDLVESRANADAFSPVDQVGGLGDVSDVVGGLVPGANSIDLRATAGDDSETQVTATVGVTVRRPVVTVGPATASEGAGVATHTVTLDHAAVAPVTARVTTADVSASEGQDYAPVDTVVTFQPGETTTTVEVPVHQDGVDEPDETYTIGAGEVSHGGSGAAAATGTIVDDDASTITVSDDSVVEGNPGDDRRLEHEITLSSPSSTPVTASVALSSGTAGVGSDVEALSSSTVTFAPGETSKVVQVRVIEDLDGEADEQYTLTVTSTSNPVADGSATGTVVNDDRLGTFTCRATALRLGGSEAVVANPPGTPCRTQGGALLPLPALNLGLIGVGGGIGTAATTSNIGGQVAPGDEVTATSRVVGLRLRVGTALITVDAIESWVRVRCGADGTPYTTSGGYLANLRVNGAPLPVRTDGVVTVPLGLATIRLNGAATANGVTTRRAIEITGALGTIVVSEARAGSAGPVCQDPLATR